jgi:zinc/manganese transport system substrate-binding protein
MKNTTPSSHRATWSCRDSRRLVGLGILLLSVLSTGTHGQDRLRVVATLPTYGSIAREIAGDLADIQSIARGDEDPHFVNARPSFAAMIQRADLFIATGLDLELWVPALLDRANNPRVLDGAPGHVTAYGGIKLLDVPETVSRAGGDIHAFGNPHIQTDPINGIFVARNIAAGLARIDPAHSSTYDQNLKSFEDRLMRRLFGDRLVEMLGKEALFTLARDYRFWEFASGQSFQGQPLTAYVGGWLAQAAAFRGQRIVCYHKNWAYFSARFRVPCAMYVERQPGIPPAPGHVRDVIDFMRNEHIHVILAANYFNRTQVERVASRTGASAVIVPEHVDGEAGVDDYFKLIDRWVTALADAFAGAPPPAPSDH